MMEQLKKPLRTTPQETGKTSHIRRTLAFFGPSMYPDVKIAHAIWPGLLDAARIHDINLLYIAGESLRPPHKFRKQANVLYDLVNTEHIDGIISWTSVLGTFVPPEEVAAFLTRYSKTPMVSLGGVVEGLPSVMMDSYQGMYAAVNHLIEVHDARQIAFIRGPADHFYAQERYQAYCDALQAHHLSLDERLISPPYAWDASYGAEAVRLLLDECGLQPHVTLDAMASVNDRMALGAMQALQARGLRVPHDLAVTGFNDDPDSSYSTPPLTSVKAPFYELGIQAIETLLTMIGGAPLPNRINVPARLVIRQSCGCLLPEVAQAAAGVIVVQDVGGDIRQAVLQTSLLAEMTQALGAEGQASTWAKQFLTAFLDEIEEEKTGVFLAALTDGLCQTVIDNGNVAIWHAALSLLRRYLQPYLQTLNAVSRAEDLWQQARTEIGKAEKRLQGYQELQHQQEAQRLRELGTALLTTFDVADLMDILYARLPHIGIPGCHLALYENPNMPTDGMRMMLAYHAQRRIETETNQSDRLAFGFLSKELFCEMERGTFIVEALYFQATQIGVVAFEAELYDGSVYNILHGEISSALQGALLVQRVQERSAEIARQKYVLDAFMANVPDSIYFKDRESRIIRSNQAHATAFGLSDPSELIGKTDFDLFPEDTARPKYETEQDIMRTGCPILDQEEPDAGGRWALTTKMPLRDEHGDIIGTFGISRDITELKKAQQALAQAYSEISLLNTQLQAENVRMSAELDVVKRLQQMILPRLQELSQIPGINIVGYMQPADEVGGDYYDVLHNDGVLHIGIGDVTGHGLESGVIMLMTQAAIRTLIEHGETDPVKFVNTLNRLIYKNVARMGADKNLTFALVQCQNGQFKLVGQHEECLVVRQGGQIERINTMDLGFPVGLEPEISDWVHAATIVLQPGEGIVLYTDGITEAENAERHQYGLDRLCAILHKHWDQPAEAIKQAVVDDVMRHIEQQKVYDDLTLVVLKQQTE